MTTQFKNLLQVLDFFKNEEVCIQYLADQRWGDTPSCPHCGNVGAYKTNRGYKCKAKECHKKFTVTTGTTFENTKISLRLWFAAMYLCTAHKKGISSLQLSRDLNITQKTAWFLLHRIREMLNINFEEKLSGTVEIDETFVGGKNINRHAKKRRELKETTGKSFPDKTPVVGMLQRDGEVRTFVTKWVEKDIIEQIMLDNVEPKTVIVTDAHNAYNDLMYYDYDHTSIKHTPGDYRTRGDKHTNSIEGFWSQLKRGINGIYHQVSPKHLHRYCHEFGYKYNTRKATDIARFEETFKKADGKRLTYAKLIS